MRKRLAVLIIVLCFVLIAFIIIAVILYNREVANDSKHSVSNSTSDTALSSNRLALSDIEQYMKNNSDNVIKYVNDGSTDINLPKSVLDGIEPYTSVEERKCVSKLLNDWVKSFNGDIAKVQFVASNYGSGYNEIVIRVSYDDKYASVHYTGSGDNYTGYIEDTND